MLGKKSDLRDYNKGSVRARGYPLGSIQNHGQDKSFIVLLPALFMPVLYNLSMLSPEQKMASTLE